jgi:L-gulono-1,4-lactone dehydrogenase
VSVAYTQRKRWRNHTGNQAVEPLRLYRPGTLAELQEIVATAVSDGAPVRAVGSGHSWSDAALTEGYLVDTHGLGRPLAVDCLRRDWHGERLERVEAGMRLRALNQVLAKKGLALLQMGGYDAQTVAGVISTSTHGSGISLGSLPDFARSIDLVAADARVHRVERADGPTDADAFAAEHPDWELHQDDDTFDAVAVGIGCMGVIYAVTLAVTEAYWLTEIRELSTWSRVRAQLPAALAGNRHYEVYINPYAGADGEHRCIVCRRNPADPRTPRALDRLRRHWWIELLSRLKVTGLVGRLIDRTNPDGAPGRIDQMLSILADNEYSGPSYKVLNIGAANLLPAYSSEIGVPLAGDRHLQAVDTLIAVADAHRRLGRAYHTGLISLRFVRGTSAYLSMMQGGDTMTIELILMTETEGGYELLSAHEDALYALGGRPHWGQVNTLTAETVRALYPLYDRWQAVRARFDPDDAFESPFTKRVGITDGTRAAAR